MQKIKKKQGANPEKTALKTDEQMDEWTDRAKFIGPSGRICVQKVREFLDLKSW